MATNKKQVRIHISFDVSLKLQVWANSKGLTLSQGCSTICEAFAIDAQTSEKVVNDKLDLIIKLLSNENM